MGQYTEEYKKIMFENMELCKKDQDLYNSILASRANQKIIKEKVKYNTLTTGINAHAETKVILTGCKSFEAAKNYTGKVAVLNFANANHPGGGCLYGASAQEESLCRCSTLYECLIDEKAISGFYQPHSHKNCWGTSDIIYTPNVTVFMSDDDIPKLQEKDKWFQVDIITCAAPNLSMKSIKDRKILRHEENIISKRIERIFNVSIKEKVDVLILGAFGCGAFNNPPDIVAKSMLSACKKYNGMIPVIEFAVYDPSENMKNYAAFLYEYTRSEFCRPSASILWR